MRSLLTYINHFQQLDQETETAIKAYFREEIFKKNEIIAEEGKVCSKICFIESGLVRRFTIKDDTEKTRWLYHDNHWITSIASYFNQRPSFEYLQACQETTAFSLSYTNEQKLMEYPLFFRFFAKFLRCSLAAFDEFHFTLESMTAQGKYQYLLEHYPLMIQRAKQKHVASLLGVSQETLSRIRADIF